MGFGDSIISTFLWIVAFLLILVFVYFGIRGRKQTKPQTPSLNEVFVERPAPPSASEVFAEYELRFPEFTDLMRLSGREVAMERLLTHEEFAQAFGRLSALSEKRKRFPGSAAMTSLRLSPEDTTEAKAAMLTMVKALYDFEEVPRNLGNDFNDSIDRFLNALT